jgi:hypothetical protein
LKEVAADLAGSVMVERLKEAAASAADSGAA